MSSQLIVHEPPLISVVILTYKRLDLLRITLNSFLSRNVYPNFEVIISDDGSASEVQSAIKKLPTTKCLFVEKNLGLGANANRGLRAARGEYILQLQDDWEFMGRGDELAQCVEVLEQLPQIGALRFYGVGGFPKVTCFKDIGLRQSKVYIIDRAPENISYCPFIYTDTPHLKRRDFHAMLGVYREDLAMPDTEIEFAQRFYSLSPLEIGYVAEHVGVFVHRGEGQSLRPRNFKARVATALETTTLGRAAIDAYRRHFKKAPARLT